MSQEERVRVEQVLWGASTWLHRPRQAQVGAPTVCHTVPAGDALGLMGNGATHCQDAGILRRQPHPGRQEHRHAVSRPQHWKRTPQREAVSGVGSRAAGRAVLAVQAPPAPLHPPPTLPAQLPG